MTLPLLICEAHPPTPVSTYADTTPEQANSVLVAAVQTLVQARVQAQAEEPAAALSPTISKSPLLRNTLRTYHERRHRRSIGLVA